MKALLENELVFCIGPAGTGKTYLAVAMAVSMLRRGRIKKIVLVRPAVEAGEHLGFLPGDLEAKINPYLRPLLDALHDLMDYEQIRRYMDNDLIEIAPLAYMRGRTLNDAVVILDEGQNATVPQMKMFLTRMGQNARIVVTGDITQVDLPIGVRSGLADAVERLNRIPGVGTVLLDRSDIVRHPLVQAIVDAYEAAELAAEREGRAAASPQANPPPRPRSRRPPPGRSVHSDSRQSERLGVRRRGVEWFRVESSGQRPRSSAIMRSSRTRRQHRQAGAASPRSTPARDGVPPPAPS